MATQFKVPAHGNSYSYFDTVADLEDEQPQSNTQVATKWSFPSMTTNGNGESFNFGGLGGFGGNSQAEDDETKQTQPYTQLGTNWSSQSTTFNWGDNVQEETDDDEQTKKKLIEVNAKIALIDEQLTEYYNKTHSKEYIEIVISLLNRKKQLVQERQLLFN
jgi:hypothetical protein